MSRPIVRWNKAVRQFFVDWGNVRFATSPEGAEWLIEELTAALKELPNAD